jgi:dihydrodipicolinate synthase/N-acetylneuraminate lyase
MSAELQAKMRIELGPRIYFKPEGNPVGPTISKLQELLNNEAIIFEGSGGYLIIDSFRRGIKGTMPGSDLIKAIIAIWKAMENNDFDRAYEIYFPMAAIVIHELPSLDAFLAVEKHLLVKQGIFKNTIVRRPTAFDLDPKTTAEVDRLFEKLMKAL